MNELMEERKAVSVASPVIAERRTGGERRMEIERKPVYDFVKRSFDILFSLLCLLLGTPLFLLIALIIVLDDPGNPFFVQERIGKDGKPFRMLKFRTMCKDAEMRKAELLSQNESRGVHYKASEDVRVLRSGRILRAASLDELPQMIHVLSGKMSVIGPRPFIPSEQAQLPLDRLAVRPGLSCYWQLADRRELTPEEELELDYQYIRERSVKTDVKIIFLTVKTVLGQKNC